MIHQFKNRIRPPIGVIRNSCGINVNVEYDRTTSGGLLYVFIIRITSEIADKLGLTARAQACVCVCARVCEQKVPASLASGQSVTIVLRFKYGRLGITIARHQPSFSPWDL